MSVTTITAVAVRFQPATGSIARISQDAAAALSALMLTPAAMIAMAFGLWRLGEDLGWTARFLISQGLFSHWVVWGALAIGLKSTANLATRGAPAQIASDSPDRERN